MNRLKKIIHALKPIMVVVAFAGILVAAQPFLGGVQLVSADATDDVCKGVALIDGPGGPSGCGSQAGTESTVSKVLSMGLGLFSMIVGIISVVMIIIGGLRYITSQGDANNTKAAKDTILYAVIGLVVVALAQIIVRFVLNSTSKAIN